VQQRQPVAEEAGPPGRHQSCLAPLADEREALAAGEQPSPRWRFHEDLEDSKCQARKVQKTIVQKTIEAATSTSSCRTGKRPCGKVSKVA